MSLPMVASGMSECSHPALTSNNAQLLGDVAKCVDTMSRIQQARAAKATVYHDAILLIILFNVL